MELYQLKSLVVIAREGNLTRAAQALNLSQSALSSQLRLLEEELGVPLFRRTPRGMDLTDQGRVLLLHAQEVLDAARRLRQKAMTMNPRSNETLTIGLNTDPAFLRIGAIYRRLSLLHAGLNVAFLTSQSATTVSLLHQGSIDVGFYYGELAGEGVERQVLGRVRICVVIPARLQRSGAPLDWGRVCALPWINAGTDCPLYAALVEHLARLRLIPHQVVSAADEYTVRELVAGGQGVALMREDEALALQESGKAQLWDQGWLSIPLGLAWRKKMAEDRKVRAVVAAIRHVWGDAEAEEVGSLADKCWV